jgi:hypothetical protein
MTWLLALLMAVIGAALGFALAAAAAAALAPLLGISSFEGASGYFAVFIGGPLGGLVGLGLGAWLVLRRAGFKGAAVAGRIALVFGGVRESLRETAALLAAERVSGRGSPPLRISESRFYESAARSRVDGRGGLRPSGG